MGVAKRKKAQQARVRESCLFAVPFPPAQARFSTPFLVCTRLIQCYDTHESFSSSLTRYWPEDQQHGNIDCEMMPLLLEIALGGSGLHGIAADVGASKGNCGYFMLSAGHTVHFFDHELGKLRSPDVAIVSMTLDVNEGWRERAHL